jgi:hypothetical protein
MNKFFQQEDGMTMGSSLSPIVSNMYMEHFERLALYSAQHKPSLCLQYVDDKFVVLPYGPEQLTAFPSLRPSIQFTVPLLDVLVVRKEMTLATKVYRKPTHTV